MNFEKIKEIIEKTKEAAPNQEMFRLVESFEEFMLLQEARSEIKEPKDWIAYIRRLQESRQKVAEHMEKTAVSLGLTPAAMKAYFENPENFSNHQWSEMQLLRKEALAEKVEKREPQIFAHKKLKNRNKNIRI